MECSLGFIDNLTDRGSESIVSRSGVTAYHLIASTNKYCNCFGIGALFNNKHLISRRAEAQLAYNSRLAELLGSEVLETGNDATLSSDRD